MFNHSLKKKFYTLQLPDTFWLPKGRSVFLFCLFWSSKLFLILFWLTIGYQTLSVNGDKLTGAHAGQNTFAQAISPCN